MKKELLVTIKIIFTHIMNMIIFFIVELEVSHVEVLQELLVICVQNSL